MSKFNRIKTWLFLMILFSGLSVQAVEKEGPKAGGKPPLLEATELLQAPPGAQLKCRITSW